MSEELALQLREPFGAYSWVGGGLWRVSVRPMVRYELCHIDGRVVVVHTRDMNTFGKAPYRVMKLTAGWTVFERGYLYRIAIFDSWQEAMNYVQEEIWSASPLSR